MRLTLACFLLAACGDGSAGPDAAPPDAGSGTSLAIACNDSVANVYVKPSGLPAYDASHRGDVIRCAPLGKLARADIAAKLGGSAQITSGADVYAIAYRTGRIDAAVEGVTSALAFVPDAPRAPGAAPLVIYAHGTVGLADKCAPSKGDPLGDLARIGLVGRGFVVVAPDYAGYGYGGPAPGWLSVNDQAHSILDGARAARQLFKAGVLTADNVIVGHSQGGHAVLGAQAVAKDYGVALKGVVAFAPVWFPIRTFAAVPFLYGPSAYPDAYAFAFLYFYGHGELLDGVGHGGDIFRADKRAAISATVAGECLGAVVDYARTAGTMGSDVYDQTFLDGIVTCAALETGTCGSAAAQKWMPRFAADRPPIDAVGAPMVIWQGMADATVTPDRAHCGVDKVAADLAAAGNATATLTTCVDATATHGTIVVTGMDWAAQWIAARTAGGAEPAACTDATAL
ncbi:MAG TPA: lipase family protein, partial [Haliangiales bacterium]|nr:lipase family protein [Haliangiales bacterium]